MDQDEPIEITDFYPDSVGRFRGERDRLRIGLATASLTFEHIGSTAVPGLAGRPIVDLMLGAPPASWAALAELRARVVAMGYQDLGEAGVPGRVFFRRRTKLRAYDVALVEVGGALWNDSLALREHLRAHPDDAAAYAAAKRAAAQGGATPRTYATAKAETVAALLDKARAA